MRVRRRSKQATFSAIFAAFACGALFCTRWLAVDAGAGYVAAPGQRVRLAPARASSSPTRAPLDSEPVLLQDESFRFVHDGVVSEVAVARVGQGPAVLLLPALSSISTITEVRDVQMILAEAGFEVVAVDWPGLGSKSKPRANWSPLAYEEFLLQVLTHVVPSPALVVAAGHAAGYVLRVSDRDPSAFGRAVLVAPTWRGPVPTMLKGRRPEWLDTVRSLVDTPLLGPVLYKLNLNDFVVRLMGRLHVYSSPTWLDEQDRMESKREVTTAEGARHASIRFVTGALDPFQDAEAVSRSAAALGSRLLVILGSETPSRSREEMDSLVRVLPRAPVILPRGRLGILEEFPNEVAQAILAFANEQ